MQQIISLGATPYMLPPIHLILANRPKLDQDESGKDVNHQNFKNVAYACPILINGQSMPWPLYSEQQVLQKNQNSAIQNPAKVIAPQPCQQ